jgi:hypothetical protein
VVEDLLTIVYMEKIAWHVGSLALLVSDEFRCLSVALAPRHSADDGENNEPGM